jgi:phosphoglycolate phosphatase-like HAD superfamily hydrolase
MNTEIKVILWDFDGVLMNSNAIRDQGFEQVLAEYPQSQVEELLCFHRRNGGLSRYVKFKYFFEEIRKENISDLQLQEWARKFSIIMMDLLIDPNLIIMETLTFVKSEFHKINMHIVSGSDQIELRHICSKLEIDSYFKSIHGSPTPKNKLVNQLIKGNNYNNDECVLIGDSINDYEAAVANRIKFIGYNNPTIESLSNSYISFK